MKVPMRSPARTIVIIGGGFCGTALATQLLRGALTQPTHVIVVERRAQLGRGVAFEQSAFPHLLNVPSQRMSADVSDELQFARFARQRGDALAAERFLPRPLYGEYLEQRLLEAVSAAPPQISFSHIRAQADALHRIDAHGPYLVSLSNEQHLLADDVVLACGDPPPTDPGCASLIAQHPAYVRNPFDERALQADTAQLLLIGTGLTMADVAIAAAALNPHINIHAMSRHGLLPAVQSCATTRGFCDEFQGYLPSGALSARGLLRGFRAMLRAAQRGGHDWRDALASARDAAPELWHRLPQSERARFLRHLRLRWDVHRHRMPPLTAERLSQLRRSGRLQIHAGRLQGFEDVDQGHRLRVQWRARGAGASEALRELTVDRVVNCAGTDSRLTATQDPLLGGLIRSGLASADGLGLGLRTGAAGALVGADGQVASHLYYIGPMLRAQHWEATAVGELRRHAQQLADALRQVVA